MTAQAQTQTAERFWVRIEEKEISWLPVREAAFLLRVLVFLIGVWFTIGWLLGGL